MSSNIPKPADTDSDPPRPSPPTSFPFHPIPGLTNFRDIGGWPITSPSSPRVIGHVRRGILYRGSDTNRITPAGITRLRELGIVMDYDLRSAQQIVKTGGFKEMEGIERVWAPVFGGEEEGGERAARERYELYAGEGTEGIVTAFVEILTAGAPTFRTILTRLLDVVPPVPSPSNIDPVTASTTPTPGPALFLHCTTGNNRTGSFIALLLLLLGVPPSSICHEYALSDLGLAPTRHINVERLLKKGAFGEYELAEARRKCERMVGAREES
ncbi:protein-tyrosine phosphatase-like protein, partial [Clohesyomyces aquaticus]